jgi:hypothetical protein
MIIGNHDESANGQGSKTLTIAPSIVMMGLMMAL